MARLVLSRLRAFARALFRIVRDLFFARLLLSAVALWPRSRFLAALLMLLLAGCLAIAGSSARQVFLALRPATEWVLGPALVAGLAFIVMLELASASLMAALRGLLRLSLDIGRHRIGMLIAMAAALCVAAAGRALWSAPAVALGSLGWLAPGVAMLVAGAFWFERAYRRPAYPDFRDFHADIVDARHYLARAAHDR